MKINILTDVSGKIIAAQHRSMIAPRLSSSGSSISGIRPAPGQALHEVELPVELESSLLKNTFARDLGAWKIQHEGKSARLAKIS
jgi:hypothetical protein